MNIVNWIDGLLPSLFEMIRTPILDKISIFLTNLGDSGAFWLGAIMILISIKKYRKLGFAALISLIICSALGNLGLKPLFGRIRPCNVDTSLLMLVPRPSDFSFPSMHTASSFSVAFSLFMSNKKIGIFPLCIATLVGLSRVYLNLHYTTDIIVGALLGILIAYIIMKIFKKPKIS